MFSPLALFGMFGGGKLLILGGVLTICVLAGTWISYAMISGSAAKVQLQIQKESSKEERQRHQVQLKLLQKEQQIDKQTIEQQHQTNAQLQQELTRIHKKAAELKQVPVPSGICPVDCQFPKGLYDPSF